METPGLAEKPCGLLVSATLRALNAALRPQEDPPPGAGLWFKESSARNLRHRDFLAPRAALSKLYQQGQVPDDIIQGICSLQAAGLPPIQNCELMDCGLSVQLERSLVFQHVLGNIPRYVQPASTSIIRRNVIINCVPLHGCKSGDDLQLGHLRAILVADHLAEILRTDGAEVHLVPELHKDSILRFLEQLKVPWPLQVDASPVDTVALAFRHSLEDSIYAETYVEEITPHKDLDVQPKNVVCRVRLRTFMEQNCVEGYDPNLDVFTVLEENIQHLAELHQAVLQYHDSPGSCSVIHIVNYEEEFQQQKVDLLWQLLDAEARTVSQKYLVCGPVKVSGSSSSTSAVHYFQLRRSQMRNASVMKYGDHVQGNSWEEIIDSLTSAAIRFEMLTTAHRCQITLALEDTSITTKGTKSGAFVMYNCARLATMFDFYYSAVRQGAYPEFPIPRELDFKSLKEEGEWLLLFNYILPFPELLSQSAQILTSPKGIRITVNTEADLFHSSAQEYRKTLCNYFFVQISPREVEVCKFLVNLSMDFSSYYNRVHILGEPLPHLYSQMFARLQLMKAVQEVLHTALATLHVPPLSQL